jgi:signal transduction histidine kinase
MLYQFINANRQYLISRIRTKVAVRLAPRPVEDDLKNGVPLFLDQLVEALRIALPSAETGAIQKGARLHGGDMLRLGFTVAQLVRSYGDVCQAVTELADEMHSSITIDEFHTLNRCLDEATAEAVTEYTRLRESSLTEGETQRSGMLAHEMRNRLSAATMAFALLKSGEVAINGSVGAIVTRNLIRLGSLIDRSLLAARVDSGTGQRQRVTLRGLVEEAEVDAALEADARRLSLSVTPVDGAIYVDVDPHILSGALANLLDNALKFTRTGGHVSLKTSATATRVLIAVEDECGGLPPGQPEKLFDAFEQRGADRIGLGLGLFIARKAVEASGGTMHVRDVPGTGCVFTIELPMVSACARPDPFS